MFIPPTNGIRALEPMALCSKGGEVFIVLTQWGQKKPKRPTHKDTEKKKTQQMKCDARFPWTWTCGVPMDVSARGSEYDLVMTHR